MVDNTTLLYHLDTLKEWDVDDFVSALNITVEELLKEDVFLERAINYIEDNYE